MIIHCKICGIALTQDLQLLNDEGLLSDEDGCDFVPKGYYYINKEENEINHQRGVSINKKDIVNWKHHRDSVRLQGCCGPSGMDGLNILCSNGHTVATEKTDCWIPHEIVFEMPLVILQDKT